MVAQNVWSHILIETNAWRGHGTLAYSTTKRRSIIWLRRGQRWAFPESHARARAPSWDRKQRSRSRYQEWRSLSDQKRFNSTVFILFFAVWTWIFALLRKIMVNVANQRLLALFECILLEPKVFKAKMKHFSKKLGPISETALALPFALTKKTLALCARKSKSGALSAPNANAPSLFVGHGISPGSLTFVAVSGQLECMSNLKQRKTF